MFLNVLTHMESSILIILNGHHPELDFSKKTMKTKKAGMSLFHFSLFLTHDLHCTLVNAFE